MRSVRSRAGKQEYRTPSGAAPVGIAPYPDRGGAKAGELCVRMRTLRAVARLWGAPRPLRKGPPFRAPPSISGP